MAQREIKVVINGEEHVTPAAKDASGAMDGFFAKSKGWTKGFADLKAAWDVVSGAVSRVSGAIMDSFAAYDELEKSQRRIEGTSKLTGMSLEYLQVVAAKGKTEFQLSSKTANDYATEVAKLEKNSGGAAKATDLLAGFLNIGAARGLSAAESLKKAQQSILGIDEGTDALFGKNPSGLWADYALVIGKSAGKFSDADKAAALAYAVMDGGTKTLGSYGGSLTTTQGKQALMNQRVEEMQAQLGKAMEPMRVFAIDLLTGFASNAGGAASAAGSLSHALVDIGQSIAPVFGPLSTVAVRALQMLAYGMSITMLQIRSLAQNTAAGVGSMLASFGTLVERGGTMLKIFGVNIVADAGKAMRETGEEMRDVAQNKLLAVGNEWDSLVTRMARTGRSWKGETIANASETMTGTAQEIESKGAVVAAAAERAADKTGAAIKVKLGTSLARLVTLTTAAIDDLGASARAQLPIEKADQFEQHMRGIAERAKEVGARITGFPAAVDDSTESTKAMAEQVGTVARSAMDVASSFGVLDSKAASALSSVERIAGSLKQGVGGGAIGALGSAVGLFATSMAVILQLDAPRRAMEAENNRMLEANNRALDRLRDEMNAQSVNVSGSDMEAATRAMSILASMPGGVTNMNGDNGGRIDFNAMMSALSQAGISGTKLDNIAKELGIAIRDKDGRYTSGGIQSLWTALQTFKPGTIGQNFGDQMQFFKDTQRVGGATGTAGGLQGFVDFLKNVGGTSLFGTQGMDLATAEGRASFRDSLFGLMTQQNNGGFGAGMMGRLTSAELRQVILDMIGMIDGIKPPAGADSGMGGGGGGGGGDTTTTTGGVTVPSWTATLITAIETQGSRSSAILTTHTALQSRIADATESTVAVLMEVRDILRDSDASARDMDAALEESRRQANLYRGVLPVLA